VLGNHPPLKLEVLRQPTPILDQPLAPVARDRRGVRLALGIQRLLGLAQPPPPIPAGP
jgi:hypothetical protein